ncbi:MAG: Hsp70 family protein, partial [Myxococcaceae bacterium]
MGPLQILSTPLDRVRGGAGPGSKGPIIGIDLGVASCKVAVVGAKGPECVTSGGQRSIATAVAVDSRGNLVVGHAAKRILASSPELGLWGPKALVDHGFHDPGAKAWRSQFRCEFFAREDGEAGVRLGDRSFAAHELVAMVLCEAREWAQNRLRVPVERAVITITPSLDGRFLGLVRRISLLAGLHLERTLFEPMAVLLSGPQRKPGDPDGTAVVCDWGASGFRFALIRTFGTRSEILVSMGEPAVSGIELDRWLYQRILKDTGVDEAAVLQSGGAAVTRLLAAAESAKIALSTRPTVKVALPCAYFQGGVPKDLALEVSREML